MLRKPYGLLLFGPRQVGKTTLIERLLDDTAGKRGAPEPWRISFAGYDTFQEYLRDPGLFTRQAEAKLAHGRGHVSVFLDEVQKLPRLLDDCQRLYDSHRTGAPGGRFRFIATGSSARKLRRAGSNLLPGRVIVKHLHPLTWEELGIARPDPEFSPFAERGGIKKGNNKKAAPFDTRPSCDDFLLYGTLPGIISASEKVRSDLLRSYAMTYLKEEIQAEALVRSLEGFSRFLELAATESGNTTNYQKLGKDIGLRLNTVKNYYSILVDTLVAIPLEPYLRNARKRMISTPKIYFFDTGVRNAAAGMPLNPATLKWEAGRLFEHWVILELQRRFSYIRPDYRLYFWRTHAGAEVDLVVDTKKELIPIEIKHSSSTSNIKLKGIKNFMDDHKCRRGYVIGNFREPEKLERGITALPWWML